MDHILDNPIWEGLNTGNKHLASGNDRVKYFSWQVTTFAGFRSFSEEEFKFLYDVMPGGSIRATFVPHPVQIPAFWQRLPGQEIHQMIDNGSLTTTLPDKLIVPLSANDVPSMLNLTKLTNPGPFNERTIEFGNFFGIFSGTQLVAMAGQRLQVMKYAEISAVCTHPDHQGKGYAKRLLLHHLKIIRDEGRIPMLHVKTDNKAAIALYESLGFGIRRKLEVIIFRKE